MYEVKFDEWSGMYKVCMSFFTSEKHAQDYADMLNERS